MLQIRDAASQQQGAALASTTKAQVDYMITHCKLDSQADVALHGIISQLLTGADMLNKAPDSPDGRGAHYTLCNSTPIILTTPIF